MGYNVVPSPISPRLHRQSEESVQEDLSRLRVRVEALRASILTEAEIQQQTLSFLEVCVSVCTSTCFIIHQMDNARYLVKRLKSRNKLKM